MQACCVTEMGGGVLVFKVVISYLQFFFLGTMLVIFQTSYALIKLDNMHTENKRAHSITCCITLKFYDFRHNFSQASDAFHAPFCITNSFPEYPYTPAPALRLA